MCFLDNRAYIVPFTEAGTCYQRSVIALKVGVAYGLLQSRIAQYHYIKIEEVYFVVTLPGFNMSDQDAYDNMISKMSLCVYLDTMGEFGRGIDKRIMVEPMSISFTIKETFLT